MHYAESTGLNGNAYMYVSKWCYVWYLWPTAAVEGDVDVYVGDEADGDHVEEPINRVAQAKVPTLHLNKWKTKRMKEWKNTKIQKYKN